MAAFPTALADLLERTSRFSHDKKVATDVVVGVPSQRTISANEYVTINCEFKHLTSSERSTLKSFFAQNGNGRLTVVTWTIDSIDYSGVFLPNHSETMDGNRYTIRCVYRAKEV